MARGTRTVQVLKRVTVEITVMIGSGATAGLAGVLRLAASLRQFIS
jgi:ABC-type uncharacterized transport system permease subunit